MSGLQPLAFFNVTGRLFGADDDPETAIRCLILPITLCADPMAARGRMVAHMTDFMIPGVDDDS